MRRAILLTMPRLLSASAALLASAAALHAQRILSADGETPAYTLIRNVLGASAETPDCGHPEFGPHITQAMDSELGKPVFVFHMHVMPDNDRCTAFDRQRLEIKTDGGSPAYLKGFLNDTVTYRWKFRLPDGFQATNNFTHIHQLKAGDGDADMPTITLTPRKGSPDRLQLIWSDGQGGHSATLVEVPLSPFLGAWVEAHEKVTYGHGGQYSIVIRRIRDGAGLLAYSHHNLDLWRAGTTFTRPKWGIYRSLNSIADLRDEQVRFDRFCLAKGSDDCPAEEGLPSVTVTAAPGTQAVAVGSRASYTVTLTPARGFRGALNLGVAGLPEGTTASFTPASVTDAGASALTVSTSPSTAPGTYALLVSAENAAIKRSSAISLAVTRSGSTPPSIKAVANAASFSTDIAPRAWVSISGANLATAARSWRADEIAGGRLPTQLDGVSLSVDGKPAALCYVSPTQINVQIPTGILAGVPVLLKVNTPQGAASAVVTLQPAAPALFTLEAENRRYVAAQHADDYAVAGKAGLYAGSRPARPGEVIALYGTGFGQTYPAVASGQTLTRAAPLASSTRVWIGGQEAEVLWAGLTAPSLYQLNVRVPDAVASGDVAVVAETAGAHSQPNVFLTVLR